jgi:hypothetical protein
MISVSRDKRQQLFFFKVLQKAMLTNSLIIFLRIFIEDFTLIENSIEALAICHTCGDHRKLIKKGNNVFPRKRGGEQ